MDLKKVKAILEWPTSRSATKVRSFYGLASFYRKFITGFSGICGPLTETMRGDRKEFKWTTGVDKNFNLYKEKVTEQPILALLDFNKMFQVDYDASGIAIGAFLSQEGRLVAYFSEKLDDAKRKYFVYDYALKKWRHYLLPKEVFLYTDHQALQYLNSQGKLNQRHLKWVEFLQSYTFFF